MPNNRPRPAWPTEMPHVPPPPPLKNEERLNSGFTAQPTAVGTPGTHPDLGEVDEPTPANEQDARESGYIEDDKVPRH